MIKDHTIRLSVALHRDGEVVELYESELTPQEVYELTHNDASLETMLVNDIASRSNIMMHTTRAFNLRIYATGDG